LHRRAPDSQRGVFFEQTFSVRSRAKEQKQQSKGGPFQTESEPQISTPNLPTNLLPAVPRGTHAECVFEPFRKLVDIRKTNGHRNFSWPKIHIKQQALSNRHASSQHVVSNRDTEVPSELIAQVAAG